MSGWAEAPGLFLMMQMAATNAIVQTIVDEDERGRVMGYHAMAFFCSAQGRAQLRAPLEGGDAT